MLTLIYLIRSSIRILPNLGQKTVTMSGNRLEQLVENYNQEKIKHPGMSFAAFIAESALMELERKKILREAQFISFVGENDGLITLKDFRKNEKFIEVQIKSGKPFCITDSVYDCIHVGFVLALPEVRKRLS